MGFFQNLTGGADTQLLQMGIPARGVILSIAPAGATIRVMGGMTERVCEFQVQVMADNQQPYQTSVRQRVAEIYIPQFVPGATVVAVRVDPQNWGHIALDFASPPPTVTVPRDPNAPSAADLLATGTAAKAVIIQTQPLGLRNDDGVDLHAFLLTVIPDGGQPYQTQVGCPTPAEALPLLYPGSNVPVKIAPDNPQAVVIDWQEALRPSA